AADTSARRSPTAITHASVAGVIVEALLGRLAEGRGVAWRLAQSLRRWGVQRAIALACVLGGTASQEARGAGRRIHVSSRSAGRAWRRGGHNRQHAGGSTVRRLRIARHHAVGGRESQ